MRRLVVVEFMALDGYLATGTDLAFTPHGAVGLRDVPGEWHLFTASLT